MIILKGHYFTWRFMCLIYRLEVWDDDILLHHHLDRAARMRRSWNHAINAGGLRVTLSWTGPPPPTPTCLPSLDKSKSCSFTVLQQPSNRSRGSEKHAPISDIIYEVDCRTLATCGIPHFRHLGSLKVKASKKSRRNFWKTKSLYFSLTCRDFNAPQCLKFAKMFHF